MTLENIIKSSGGKSNYKITVEGKPVYDYKATELPYVNLIYGSYEGIESENIDLLELVDFCNSILQPYQTIEFADEFTNKKLNKFTWYDNTLDLTY